MPLELKIGITDNKDSIIISDITGDYNAISNPTGWGGINPAHTSTTPVSAISLDIFLPGTTTAITPATSLLGTTFFTSTDRAYNLYTDISSVVPATFVLQDGVWKYVVNFTISSVVYPVTIYSLRVNSLKCAIGELALSNMDINNFEEVKTMYDRMVQAFECEEYVLTQELYEEINEMLSDSDCNSYSIGCSC